MNHYDRAFHRARAVWHYLSQPGQANASIKEISEALGIPESCVQYALRRLYAIGHIEHAPKRNRGRVVRLPFGGTLP